MKLSELIGALKYELEMLGERDVFVVDVNDSFDPCKVVEVDTNTYPPHVVIVAEL